ncbi:MAG: hypothetical protein HS114_01730 [Anaerolineales bacterium]|nr:hypothetical protein [Anaerolineales bacterium]
MPNPLAPPPRFPTRARSPIRQVLSNSGDSKASGAVLTDTLPAGVAFAQWVSGHLGRPRAATSLPGPGRLMPARPSPSPLSPATPGGLYGETIVNTAVYSHTSGSEQASAAFTVEPDQSSPATSIFLPLLLKTAKFEFNPPKQKRNKIRLCRSNFRGREAGTPTCRTPPHRAGWPSNWAWDSLRG